MGRVRHTIVETPEFLTAAKRIFTDDERLALIDDLSADPTRGDVMEGSGGARKLRWAAKGKGKSGGARIITFYSGASLPLFLLAAFSKGERANLSKAERNELRDVLSELARTYRRRKAS
eukprot:TRINITY_DN21943_c0_g1_i1.p1 TRINITY_DN21943_c0_g1~~TRINITY_DN21943_c0_g1_i1.p1  ORF type:complete len:119 (+),score=17.06 TRINITY_DN21943_c0_g1_i1:72-428(+)